jgi:hypothetical protein
VAGLIVAVCATGRSYLPEASAYKAYGEGQGWVVHVGGAEELPEEADVAIRFMGLRALQGSRPKARVEVHEYHSLSTGRAPKLKDAVKRIVNRGADGKIFLNEVVHRKAGHGDGVPYIYRDMGVDAALFGRPMDDPPFDLVYAGSLMRPGLLTVLEDLAARGIRTLVAGSADSRTGARLREARGVEWIGRVGREELPDVYRQARRGLNYTPDRYPWNIQTSTKVLEYCAAGLEVVSNRYAWVDQFEREREGAFWWLEDRPTKLELELGRRPPPDVRDLEWGRVLDRAGFSMFVEELSQRRG